MVNFMADTEKIVRSEHSCTALWLYLDLSHGKYLEDLVEKCGFEVHHSKYPKRDPTRPQLVLTKWLDE